jgi:hypothetical protein
LQSAHNSISSPTSRSNISQTSVESIQIPIKTLLAHTHIQPNKIVYHQPIIRTIQETKNELISFINRPDLNNTPIAELNKLDKSIQMSGIHIPFFSLD